MNFVATFHEPIMGPPNPREKMDGTFLLWPTHHVSKQAKFNGFECDAAFYEQQRALWSQPAHPPAGGGGKMVMNGSGPRGGGVKHKMQARPLSFN